MKNLEKQQAAMRERWRKLKESNQSRNEFAGRIAALARWAQPRLSRREALERKLAAMRERHNR
jgi:hypothetical protein